MLKKLLKPKTMMILGALGAVLYIWLNWQQIQVSAKSMLPAKLGGN